MKRRVQGKETQWHESFPYLILRQPISVVLWAVIHCQSILCNNVSNSEASRFHQPPFIDREKEAVEG